MMFWAFLTRFPAFLLKVILMPERNIAVLAKMFVTLVKKKKIWQWDSTYKSQFSVKCEIGQFYSNSLNSVCVNTDV